MQPQPDRINTATLAKSETLSFMLYPQSSPSPQSNKNSGTDQESSESTNLREQFIKISYQIAFHALQHLIATMTPNSKVGLFVNESQNDT